MTKISSSYSFPALLSVAATLFLLVVLAATLLHGHRQLLPWTDALTPPPPAAMGPQSPPRQEDRHSCDLFRGEWVPDPEAPYYTNESCPFMDERQNCMKNGRPDGEFLRWRWRPEQCDLPAFNAAAFLELARGKSMAFVGDSLARNHMQSLLCLLNAVSIPKELYKSKDNHFFVYRFPKQNFTIASFWSPFLVRADPTGPDEVLDGAVHLHIDEPDPRWAAEIKSFDLMTISASMWFFRPSYLYVQNKLVGCYRCRNDSIMPTTLDYVYRRAFRTAFAYLNGRPDYKGTTILRTFSPTHFENGEWNKGGDCPRRHPFGSNETRLDYYAVPMYSIPIEEFGIAKEAAERRGLKYMLLDITNAMLLRPDGHPSRYGHPLNETAPKYRDCAHWCLPGPIDGWSSLFFEMLRREK